VEVEATWEDLSMEEFFLEEREIFMEVESSLS
jgi:hypothetical protein